MLKISDALRDMINASPWLIFGFHHRLFNLTKVSAFLRTLVEARTHKEVQPSAILMNLSRLQSRRVEGHANLDAEFFVDKIHIHSGLCTITFPKSEATHRHLYGIVAKVHERRGFLTLTEGIGEITVILGQENLDMTLNTLAVAPRLVNMQVGAVGVSFQEKFLAVSGLLYRLLQHVALQNINVIEITSTATEFNIFLDEADVRLAFDSIYQGFSKRTRRAPKQ